MYFYFIFKLQTKEFEKNIEEPENKLKVCGRLLNVRETVSHGCEALSMD